MEWPNGQLVRHSASPVLGYDLCYSARPGSPVTVYTARQGLKVHLGGTSEGVLERPLEVQAHWGVTWAVSILGGTGVESQTVVLVGFRESKPALWVSLDPSGHVRRSTVGFRFEDAVA